MRATYLILILMFSVGIVLAEEGDPNTCAAIKNDVERLECFDLIFSKSVIVNDEDKSAEAVESAWHQRIDQSKIDDSKSVYLWTANVEPVSNEYGRNEPILLIIRCLENTTSMHFQFDRFFMADGQGAGRVTFRVDDREAFSLNLTESTDHRALGLWRGGVSIPFIKRIMDGDKLIVRARPYSGSFFTTSFNIAGLEEEVKPLREACHW